MQTDFAQVNLGTVLFGVADDPVEPTPELRVPKVTERALISIPPFTITGHIHLLPERSLHQALGELLGRFIPVTDAVYWSDRVGEARTEALSWPSTTTGPTSWRRTARSTRGPVWIARENIRRRQRPTTARGPRRRPRPADPAWPDVDRPS